MKERNYGIELLRIVSMFCVIVIHMSMGYFDNIKEIGGADWIISSIFTGLSKFSVPVFFIITSYFFFEGNIRSGEFIAKSIKKISIPFIAWSFIYYINNGIYSFFDFLKPFVYGGISFHLWFVYTYIIFIMALPVIRIMHNRLSDTAYKSIAYVSILIACIIPLAINYGWYNRYMMNPYRPDLLIYAIITPLTLGAKVKKSNMLMLFFISSVASILFAIYESESLGSPSYAAFNLSSAFVVIQSFSLFFIFREIKTESKIVILSSGCTFGVYLSHWIIYLIADKNQIMIHSSATISILFDSVFLFLLSYLIVFFIRKTKASIIV